MSTLRRTLPPGCMLCLFTLLGSSAGAQVAEGDWLTYNRTLHLLRSSRPASARESSASVETGSSSMQRARAGFPWRILPSPWWMSWSTRNIVGSGLRLATNILRLATNI